MIGRMIAPAAPCRRLCAVYTDVRSSESRSNFIDLSDRFGLASNLELSDEWVVNNAKGTQRLAVADLGMALLIAEAEDGHYEPIGPVATLGEALGNRGGGHERPDAEAGAGWLANLP